MHKTTQFILSTFMTTLTDLNSKQIDHIASQLASVVRAQILAMSFRILAGCVFACAAVLSFFHLGNAIETLNAQFYNGPVFNILAFSSLAIISGGALYMILRAPDQSPPINSLDNRHQPSLETIAMNFVEGFVEGFQSHQESTTPAVKTAAEHEAHSIPKN